MALLRGCIVTLLLLTVSLVGYCTPPPVGTHTLEVGELTISYPDGLESQARELATIAEQTLPAHRALLQHVSQYLGDDKALAKQIAQQLGQPKAEKKIRERLKLWPAKHYDHLFFSALTHWRLYRVADVRASGTFTDGATTIKVDPATGEIVTRLECHFTDGKPTASLDAFFPFYVNDDGTIRYDRKEPSLAADVMSMIDGWATMRLGVIHEVTEGYLVEDCHLTHPYARWFNDGVANWVMYRLAVAAVPEMTALLDELCLPGKDEPARDKVNLWAWRQAAYGWSSPTAEDNAVDLASYRFSTELIQRCFDDQPADALGKVLQLLKNTPANADAICMAITTVTGKEARSLLFDYVPAQVKDDIQQNRAEAYFILGRNIRAGNYQQCVNNLTRSIQANPLNPSAHLYLAWALRKLGNHDKDADNAIIIACVLGLQDTDYLQFAQIDDPDVIYICTRIRQLAGK